MLSPRSIQKQSEAPLWSSRRIQNPSPACLPRKTTPCARILERLAKRSPLAPPTQKEDELFSFALRQPEHLPQQPLLHESGRNPCVVVGRGFVRLAVNELIPFRIQPRGDEQLLQLVERANCRDFALKRSLVSLHKRIGTKAQARVASKHLEASVKLGVIHIEPKRIRSHIELLERP